MKVFYVFLLVLVFGVVSSHGRTNEYFSAAAPSTTFSPIPCDEFLLVQQWPKSFCSVSTAQCDHNIPPYFTVHGLWAQSNRRSVICKGRKSFDPSKINPDMKSNLETHWPNLKGKNQDFWRHEYDKHASCISLFQDDQVSYFSSTLRLAKEHNVTNMLSKLEIRPGKKHYPISEISKAISSAIKVKPTLECNKAEDGTVQLYQIYLCFDENLQPKNCQKLDKDCPAQTGNSLISFPHPLS